MSNNDITADSDPQEGIVNADNMIPDAVNSTGKDDNMTRRAQEASNFLKVLKRDEEKLTWRIEGTGITIQHSHCYV